MTKLRHLHTNRQNTTDIIETLIPKIDDPNQPVLTFRVLRLLGALFTIILSFINQFYWFRENPVVVAIWLVQLLAYPAGLFLSRYLPTKEFSLKLPSFSFGNRGRSIKWSLNPGPFNTKEHVLITIMANTGAGTAYSMDIIVIQRIMFKEPVGFGIAFLILLTSQCLGYALAGFVRRLLVEPLAMIWPSTLTNVAMFRTLHETKKVAHLPNTLPESSYSPTTSLPSLATDAAATAYDDGNIGNIKRSIRRVKFFWIALALSFVWYFISGWAFTTLSMVPILCFDISAQSNWPTKSAMGRMVLDCWLFH